MYIDDASVCLHPQTSMRRCS